MKTPATVNHADTVEQAHSQTPDGKVSHTLRNKLAPTALAILTACGGGTTVSSIIPATNAAPSAPVAAQVPPTLPSPNLSLSPASPTETV